MRVLVVVLLALTTPALANPRAAAIHDKQGKAYFEARQYDDAIGEFKKSYALVKKPVTLFKIAQAHYQKADYAGAIDFYQQYLQADPEGPLAKEALQFTTVAKQKLDEERAKAAAAEAEKKRIEDEQRRAQEEEKRKAVIAGHVKNAEAFVKAGTWASAGDEYMAACLAGGDAALMVDAGDAYRKHPDHAKATDAYRQYLARVPTGGRSDEARGKLADTVREQQEAERKRVAVQARDRPEDVPKPPPIARGWSSYGGRLAGGFSQPTSNPIHVESSNGLVGGPAFEVGVFARFQLTSKIALRPEVSGHYRRAAFDGQMQGVSGVTQEALVVMRAGVQLAVPIYVTLGSSGDGFRLGAGPWIGLMPYMSSEATPPFPDAGDPELLDVGAFVTAEYDFGLVSIEFRFARALHQMTEDVDATAWTALVGTTVGIGVAR